MIRLNKNASNNIVCTLSEKTTLSNPTYLLEIQSKENHSSKVVKLGSDISSNTIRWNEFVVT